MGLFSKLTKGIGNALKSIGKTAKGLLPTAISGLSLGLGGGLTNAGGLADLSSLSPLQKLGIGSTGGVLPGASASGGFDLGGVLQAGLGAALGSAADQLAPKPKAIAPGALPRATQSDSTSMLPLIALGVAALFFLR